MTVWPSPAPTTGRTGVTLGLDARGLNATGIGRYLREVTRTLLVDARFRRIILLGDPAELHRFLGELPPADAAVVRAYRGSWYSRRTQTAWLAASLRRETVADVWFFPVGDVPLLAHPRRSVVTIHDLTPLMLPQESAAKLLLAKRVLLRTAVAKARRVITVSESTRRDVAALFPGAEARTEVVHLGVDPLFTPLTDDERRNGDAFVGLSPFLLGVGNRLPHKNWCAAVDTLALLRADGRDLRLVMAGGRRGSSWDETLRHAQARGVANAVVDLGNVTEAELRSLYGRCVALVFPSRYEGFGLPALEAMACGAPVISSSTTSLPEVVGDAGFLLDPHDVAGMAEAVRRLEREPGLREEMVQKGLARAACFSWDVTTRRTADILHHVATAPVEELTR